MADSRSIMQEIYDADINPEYFKKFYDQFKSSEKIPSREIFPQGEYSTIQYAAVITYLKEKKIFDNDGKINGPQMRLLDTRLKLEDMLANPKKDDPEKRREPYRSTGGLLPCREERGFPKSSGGIAPCRE